MVHRLSLSVAGYSILRKVRFLRRYQCTVLYGTILYASMYFVSMLLAVAGLVQGHQRHWNLVPRSAGSSLEFSTIPRPVGQSSWLAGLLLADDGDSCRA